MIKLLIFDLDGTLIDSIQDITDALNHAIQPFCRQVFHIGETKKYVGSGVKALIKDIVKASRQEEQFENVFDRFLSYYSKHLVVTTRPFEGVMDVLNQLNDGYQKAVISNKKESLTKEILKTFHMDVYFKVVLGGDSLSEKKPSPMPVSEVLKRLSIDKSHAVMIGDSEQDIEAGKASGINTIAVAYGYREKEKLKEAYYLIDDIRELMSLLDNESPFQNKTNEIFFKKL